jgi:hypothetical protein
LPVQAVIRLFPDTANAPAEFLVKEKVQLIGFRDPSCAVKMPMTVPASALLSTVKLLMLIAIKFLKYRISWKSCSSPHFAISNLRLYYDYSNLSMLRYVERHMGNGFRSSGGLDCRG